MDIIERLDPQGFAAYLKKYQNTICGRHPIGVLLNVSCDGTGFQNLTCLFCSKRLIKSERFIILTVLMCLQYLMT